MNRSRNLDVATPHTPPVLRWLAVVATMVCAIAVLEPAALAALVPQVGRCTAPFDTPGFSIATPLAAGYGNFVSTRSTVVSIAFAKADPGKTEQQEIVPRT